MANNVLARLLKICLKPALEHSAAELQRECVRVVSNWGQLFSGRGPFGYASRRVQRKVAENAEVTAIIQRHSATASAGYFGHKRSTSVSSLGSLSIGSSSSSCPSHADSDVVSPGTGLVAAVDALCIVGPSYPDVTAQERALWENASIQNAKE